jgi:hypothetical protein
VLGCTFAGVYLLVGLAWALVALAGLLLADLIADLLTERTPHGRAGGPTGT